MNTESDAISYLKLALGTCDILDPRYIKDGDKEPIWDGYINIHDNKNHSNENLIGRCHVQVKGRYHKIKDKDLFNYHIERVFVEKYLIEDGTMFFLVNIYEGNHEIYYSCLLPYKIKTLLKETQNDKIKIPLKKLPKEKNEIECLFRNFIYDQKKQKNAHAIFDLTKIDKSKRYEISYLIPESSLKFHNPVEYIKKNDVFIYCLDGSFVYPVGEVKDIIISNDQIIEKKITINERIFYEKYRIVNSENKYTIYFGKGFSIEIIKKGEVNPNIEFLYKGSLSDRIKDTEFIIELLLNKKFFIDNVVFHLNFTDDSINESIVLFENLLNKYNEIQCFLFENNVSKDLNIDELSDNDINYIFNFVEKNKKNEIQFVDNKIDLQFFTPKFGNIKILFMCLKNEKGIYEIKNFFKNDFNLYANVDDVYIEYSHLLLLKKSEFLFYDNIDYNFIFDNIISKGKNDKYFEVVNLFILELLLAYDENKGVDKELLKLSKRLIIWLIDNNQWEKYNIIFKINYLQILRRESTLSDDNRLEINKIIIENSKDNSILTACYILLDDHFIANNYFNKLTKENQTKIRSFPIYNLNKFDKKN